MYQQQMHQQQMYQQQMQQQGEMYSVPDVTEQIMLEPEYYERIIEVPKVHIENVERLIEVPQPQIVDRIIQIPHIQEVVKEIPGDVEIQIITREVPKIEVRTVERIVEVPQIEYEDRYVEVEEVREVVRRIPRVEVHEIPIERIIRVPKKIVQEIEQPIYRPVPHLVQQRVEREIPVPKVQVQTMEVVRQVAMPMPADIALGGPLPQGFTLGQATEVRAPPPEQRYVQQQPQPQAYMAHESRDVQYASQGEFGQAMYGTMPSASSAVVGMASAAAPLFSSSVVVAPAVYVDSFAGTPPTPPAAYRPMIGSGTFRQAAPAEAVSASIASMGVLPQAPQSTYMTAAQPNYTQSMMMAPVQGQASSMMPLSASMARNPFASVQSVGEASTALGGTRLNQSFGSSSVHGTYVQQASAFDMLDRNHDGQISRAEFNQAATPLPSMGFYPAQAPSMSAMVPASSFAMHGTMPQSMCGMLHPPSSQYLGNYQTMQAPQSVFASGGPFQSGVMRPGSAVLASGGRPGTPPTPPSAPRSSAAVPGSYRSSRPVAIVA
mmetsp:Transcript_42309/g.119693  ORF Transcript_42309/g.119693 Transcript_42309/m.119693 type:complete len:548 (+) Transcript_42309:2-1645(+)